MARIAHLSDLHFGAHDPAVVAGLEAWLAGERLDLVVVSGDWTQRARRGQFRAAARLARRIRDLGLPLVAVAGNHDVPLYDVFRRFVRPLRRYRRYIDADLCPWFENDRLAVLGINTARSLTFKDGRINEDQMRIIRDRFAGVGEARTKILVTHHPLFGMPIGEAGRLSEAVGRQEGALAAIAKAGVHLLLAGHFHRSFAGSARELVKSAGPALVVQAGTATSVRIRAGERQSFNLIDAMRNDSVGVRVMTWDGAGFSGGDRAGFALKAGEWRALPP